MKRRGVYEAECLASSRRIATSPLIPLAFQLQGWNSGEDGLPSAAHSSRAGTSGRPSTSRYNVGWPQPMLEAPADEAGSGLQPPGSSSGKLHALFMLSLLKFFKIFWFTLASWTRTQHRMI